MNSLSFLKSMEEKQVMYPLQAAAPREGGGAEREELRCSQGFCWAELCAGPHGGGRGVT